jgi:hypothetical protein
MGCDIHCYVEYRPVSKPDKWSERWQSFGTRINPGRNYSIFGALAGVRDEAQSHPPVRGLPDDAGYSAADDYWLWIADTEDEGCCSRENADRYHAHGARYRSRVGEDIVINPPTQPQWVEHPDWHTASWVTPDEWRAAIDQNRYGGAVKYVALLAAMRSLEAQGQEVRMVFWFDN